MIAVFAKDAGSAEVVSSYVRRNGLQCCYVLEGPARAIFERKLGPLALVSMDEAITRADWILIGSGGQSGFDQAVARARAAGKRSVAVLDHWVNYRERFERDGVRSLPDEIWAGDIYAERLARATWPDAVVQLHENAYFKDIEDELASCPAPPGGTGCAVLFVCEPVRAHSLMLFGNERHRGYVEEDALRFFLSHLDVLGKPVRDILLRPHPTEPADKYAWVAREFDLPVRLSDARPLVQEVAACDVVAGCESMAMVVGLLAHKRVLSCIPPGGQACSLPFPAIEHLRTLAAV